MLPTTSTFTMILALLVLPPSKTVVASVNPTWGQCAEGVFVVDCSYSPPRSTHKKCISYICLKRTPPSESVRKAAVGVGFRSQGQQAFLCIARARKPRRVETWTDRTRNTIEACTIITVFSNGRLINSANLCESITYWATGVH